MADFHMIGNEELVYRSVPIGQNWFQLNDNGTYVINSSAFSDRMRQVSVDRASIIGAPQNSRVNLSDGILVLKVGDIRSLDRIGDKVVDVIEDAPPPPHALVVLSPEVESDSQFKKLRERLKRVARWEIEPEGLY